MKVQMKKIIATLMVGAMISSVVPSIGVSAAEDTERQTIEENLEILQEGTEQKSNNGADESSEWEKRDTEWGNPETEVVEEQGLNYLYINKSYVDEQETQNIMVSWGDEESVVTHMTLQVENEEGRITSIEGTKYEANTVLFSSTLPKGSYQVTRLEIDGESVSNVSMEEYGIHAGFGVGEEYSGEKSEYQGMESVEAIDNVEYAVADVSGMNLEEDAEQVAGTLANVDVSSIATMSLNDSEISTQSLDGQLIVVLDPGHDSGHTGARANGVEEEVATLKIAQYCKEELEKYSGVKVYLTRTDAMCPFPETIGIYKGNLRDIEKRTAWAKTKGADVFVSIHLNSLKGSAAHGAEVYYPSQSVEGKNLAQKIQNELVALGLYDRKIKTEDAYTVINSSMANGFPGLIVEHAFVSNYSDATNYLKTEAGLQRLGIADATGIAKYYGLTLGEWKTDANGNVYYYKNGKKVYGECAISGKWYHFDEKTGIRTTGWYDFPSKRVYYDADGAMVYGEKSIDGQWYYFDTSSGEMVIGWYDLPNKKVYYGRNGAMVYGEKSIDGQWYYFDTSSGAMVIGWYNLLNKKVYYGRNGAMVYGEKSIDGQWYYFDTSSGAMVIGWYDLPNKRVYYGKNGAMVYGTQNINDKIYEFDKETGALLEEKYGEIYIDGEWYFINANGEKVIGWYNFPNKKVYYGKDGAMVHGEYAIDGQWYYFDMSSGAMKTGWYDLPNKRVYYGSNGSMVYGKQIINGKTYEFDRETGALLEEKNGEIYVDGKWYFINANGEKVIGWHDFTNKRVYYGTDGAMVYGEKYIDGKWYYFDMSSGAMTIGWHDFTNKRVYYGTDGVMVYSEKYIDGKWYYFDTSSGAMKTGWHTFSNKKVYYGLDGSMKYGKTTIDGKQYYFDTSSGAVVTLKWIDGQFYGEDGAMVENVSETFYCIEGNTSTNVEQMVRFYERYSSIEYPTEELGKGGAATIKELAQIYYEEAELEHIKAEVAWTQAMLETGFLKFGGQVHIEQFNFAGLGATDGGARGADFSSYGSEGVRMGVRAQIQHLKAYASSTITVSTLAEKCVDPRFGLVSPKGCAQYVEMLGVKENPNNKGWATSEKYGFNIRKLIEQLKNI